MGAVVPEGGRGHGQGRLGVGRGAGRRRLVAHAADRGVHVDHAAGRPAARDEHPDDRHGRAAARPDPAAVGRGRAERRRPQGAQGHRRRPTRRTRTRSPACPAGCGVVADVRRRPAAARRRCCSGAVVGLKAWRRRRRRSADVGLGPVRRRLARAGRPRPRPGPAGAPGPTVTRREQSVGDRVRPGAARWPAAPTASSSARALPTQALRRRYWEAVDAERRAMSQAVGRRQRAERPRLQPGRSFAARAGPDGSRRGRSRRRPRSLIGVLAAAPD